MGLIFRMLVSPNVVDNFSYRNNFLAYIPQNYWDTNKDTKQDKVLYDFFHMPISKILILISLTAGKLREIC